MRHALTAFLLTLTLALLLLASCGENGDTPKGPSLPDVSYDYVGAFDGRELKLGFLDGTLYVTGSEDGKVSSKIKTALGIEGEVTQTITYVAWGEVKTENGMTTVVFETEFLASYRYGGKALGQYERALKGDCPNLDADKAETYRNRLAGIPEATDLRPYDAMTFRLDEENKTFIVEGYEGRSGLLKREYRDGCLAKETVGKASGSLTETEYFSDGRILSEAKYAGDVLQTKTVYNEEGAVMEEYVRGLSGEGVKTVYWSEGVVKSTVTYDADGKLLGSLSYDEKGNLTESQDSEGNVMQNEYDEAGRYLLRKTLYPDGTVTSMEYRYDEKGRIVWLKLSYRDGVSYVSEYLYNEKDAAYKETTTRSDGAVMLLERFFDEENRLMGTKEQAYDGAVTETERVLSEDGKRTILKAMTVTAPDGGKTVTEYDLIGNILSETAYDKDGNKILS